MTEYRDYLTGILNRMGLFNEFDKLDKDLTVNVLFFDIDNFKTVNDMYGHKKGDDVLSLFAGIITENAPKESLVARLGGDEFVTIILAQKTRTEIADIAQSVIDSVKKSKSADRACEIISASIGILLDYNVSEGLDNALSLSDKAMYFAKEQGKDTFVFYEDYEEILDYESVIERNAAGALEAGQFIVKYHPTLHMQSSKIVCTDACCLWVKEDGTVLGRNDFRPILQKSGFINKIDMFVFETVCKDLCEIKKVISHNTVVDIQFSHLLLMDLKFASRLEKVIKKYNLSASDFEISFDESALGGRTAVEKIMQGLKKLRDKGFTIAIGRFGEDFSSIRYLKELPLSLIKLDGDFINENLSTSEGVEIIRSVVRLGRGFKLPVCACRIDDEASMITLAECGCDAASGSFFCDKLSVSDYIEFLKAKAGEERDTVSYRFMESLSAQKPLFDGIIEGEGVTYVKGISDCWGGINFPGGPSRSNQIKLPVALFDSDSFSFAAWVKPLELQNWVSLFYIRGQKGFASFMPNIAGGRCMFRLVKDTEFNVWHDAMTGGISVGKWSYVTCTFDSLTSVARIYINGEQEAVITNVPDIGAATEVRFGGDVFQISFCGHVSALQFDRIALDGEEIKQRYEGFIKEAGYSGNAIDESISHNDIYVHDPHVFENPETGNFYIYGTDGVAFSSRDMIHWNSIGKVVPSVPTKAKEWTGSDAIWAPDIIKTGDEYRLYCSNSSWGTNKSCIFLATSDRPEGPFRPKDIVFKTSVDDTVNAIDANIITDRKTGEQYMVYGSFWNGIYMLKLNRETGLAEPGQGYGKQIAARPLWNDGAIEGPYIIYYPETDYYYLFVSYGSLLSDYNIRVGRSKFVTGPYIDYNGRDMVDYTDKNCSTGLMIACGYRYLSGQAYMGPGHNSVLVRENGEIYLVSHIRKMSFNADPGPGLLQIRKIILTPDGWPILLGQPYNAETLIAVRDELICGDYERIELRPSIPQGISHAHPMKLMPDGKLEMGSVKGTWTRTGEFSIELKYGPISEYVHFEKGLDKEKNRTTVVMCGLTSQGVCTWAKKEELSYN